MIKKGRVRHISDSRLRTSLDRRKPGEKVKYIELSANTVAFISCRCRLRLQTSLDRRKPGEKIIYIELSAIAVAFIRCKYLQLMKALYILHFHQVLSTPVMSIDVSQVGVLFNILLSFHISRFSFYINISLCDQNFSILEFQLVLLMCNSYS